MMEPPLSDVRVLAVEQYGAGPFGTLFLAMMGAEVIKIENPAAGGDVSRGVGPYFVDDGTETDASLFFQGLNHNKKSLALDLSSSDGMKIFHDLVGTADAVFTNLRGDVPEKLWLTYDQLKQFNPKIVCAHLTGYGRDNEREKQPGYDYIMQAETGYFHLTGEPDAPPTRFGLSIVDLMAGVTMSLGLTSSLYQATRSGQGRDVDVSLFDVSLYNLNYVAMWYLNANAEQHRVKDSAHFALVPCQQFKTKDAWIYVMCNKEKFWKNLCNKISAEHLLIDTRFADFRARLENKEELSKMLGNIFATKTTDEWMQQFGSSVPASPIFTLAEALSNPFLARNDNIVTSDYGNQDTLQFLRNPIRFDESVPVTAAPTLGQHTAQLLAELGYDQVQIDSLRNKDIVF